MGVPQWTTPTFTLQFTEEDLDLTQAENVYVTFKSGGYSITKTGEALDVSEKQIDVYLTQEECGGFAVGSVEVQANWTDGAGDRCASYVAEVEITKQLLKRVIV